MHKQIWRYLLLALALGLAACQSAPAPETGPEVSRSAEDSLVGVEFRHGVECLGDEARPLAGGTIYVSPDGDDANDGASEASALRTLARALCNVKPGQTVRVLPGTYRESVILGLFGDDSAPITIQGVLADGQRPVLDGEQKRTRGLGFVESKNIVVENLEFRNYTDEGLYFLIGSKIVIRNNLFAANGRASINTESEGEGFGVNVVGAADVTIEDNEATENGPSPERVKTGILGTGINTFQLRNAVIRNNRSHHNTGGGILVEDSLNVLVEGNTVYGNELDAGGDYWDGAIWVDGGREITLRGNDIYDNRGPGLQLSDEDNQYPANSRGYRVEGNVITGNKVGVYIWNFRSCPLPGPDVVVFDLNIIEGNTDQDIWCLP